MAYEYEGELLDYASGSKTYEEYKAMMQELKEVYCKAKAWDNYVDSVRSLVSKHADEDTDIEKEVRDILSVYMEDE